MRSGGPWLNGRGPYSEEAESSRSRRSLGLPVALGGGIHVVPDADGLFEKTLHAAEVDAAVDEVLHGAETGGWTSRRRPSFTLPFPCLPVYPPHQRLVGGLHQLSAQQAPRGCCGPPGRLIMGFEFRFPCHAYDIHPTEHMMARRNGLLVCICLFT